MKCEDVYWADLTPRSGSEQQGLRPVIIVSHDGLNRTAGWQSLIVVPITTSTAQAYRWRSAVSLPAGAGGLKKASIALCHQVTTLDRSKLSTFIGSLDKQSLSQIDDGLKAAMQLP